ncbi:hypothetical protein TNCV_3209341 [Trichonephila clavipes]|nr:hypothetical protein TNCV_3209341 [Trichonephila clavipes]
MTFQRFSLTKLVSKPSRSSDRHLDHPLALCVIKNLKAVEKQHNSEPILIDVKTKPPEVLTYSPHFYSLPNKSFQHATSPLVFVFCVWLHWKDQSKHQASRRNNGK